MGHARFSGNAYDCRMSRTESTYVLAGDLEDSCFDGFEGLGGISAMMHR
jgi:hypothetical protein